MKKFYKKCVSGLLLVLSTLPSLCLAVDYPAFVDNTQVRLGVVSNFIEGGLFESFIELDNQSTEKLPKGKNDWAIYFHFVRTIVAVQSDGVAIDHLQGDLYRLTPKKSFPGVAANSQLRIHFRAKGYISSYAYLMPNVFMVAEGEEPHVFANTATEDYTAFTYPLIRPEQLQRFASPVDQFPVVTPAIRYDRAYSTELAESKVTIIPTPQDIHISKGFANLNLDWKITQSGGLQFAADYLKRQLQAAGLSLDARAGHGGLKTIHLAVSDQLKGDEAYELDVTSQEVTVRAETPAGIFYGVQSLLSLLPLNTDQKSLRVPAVRIFDEPRFRWRGMHYDIARNFHGKDAILTLLEQMGRYKLNRLHLHLADDEGWRLAIPGIPELTAVGGNRCFDEKEERCLLTQLGSGPFASGAGSGFLSRADFIELIRFAAQRNIQLIPEIDMPGHARAAVVAMKARYRHLLAQGEPQRAVEYLLSDPDDVSEYASVQNYSDNAINVCMESSYRFIGKVLYEIQRMYRDAGAPLNTVHIGGDEVGKGAWLGSPVCQQLFAEGNTEIVGVDDLKPYFVGRVAAMANRRGVNIMGWEDGLMYDQRTPFRREALPTKRVIANAWDNIWENGVADRAYILANAGYEVVLSSATHLYFDHPTEVNPHNRGYHWAARVTDLAKVFSFMPDNLYANAQRTLEGERIGNLNDLVGKVNEPLRATQNIIGMQGQLWTETVRTVEQVEEMVFPRLIALAERAWHKAAWEEQGPQGNAFQRDWQQFLHRLQTVELPRLSEQGVNYYLPPPGVKVSGNSVHLKSVYPEAVLELSLDGGKTWSSYLKQSVMAGDAVRFRSRLGPKVSRSVTTAIE